MSDLRSRIRKVTDAQKAKDPVGYQRAEKSEELPRYLADELKKAGITVAEYMQATGQKEKLTTFSDDFDKYIDMVSDALDDNLYEPYYQANLPPNHMGIANVLQQTRTAKSVADKLRTIKALSGIASALCLVMFLKRMTQGQVFGGLFYLLFSADLLRLSYNCYIKRYLSSAINSLGGNAAKASTTLFKMAQSAAGITDPADDPLLKLKHDVMWELLFEDMISTKLINKVRISFV